MSITGLVDGVNLFLSLMIVHASAHAFHYSLFHCNPRIILDTMPISLYSSSHVVLAIHSRYI